MDTDEIRLLIETDRRKDQFLSMLVHELRNPLAALAAAAEFLQLGGLDPAQRERIDAVIVRQVRQLCRLADDLLDVARILRDKFELHLEAVDLQTVVAEAVEATRPSFDARGHQLRVSLPERLPLYADRARLVQVFVNLLSNAAKFTRDEGKITITAEKAVRSDLNGADDLSREEVVVRVRDNGAGMAAELVPQVFDLFVQAGTSPGRAQGGLGVGLTLVRRLVRLHGGSVWASSAGPGQGSEFCVRLPLAVSPP